MEFIIPKATPLIQLELFQKRMLKQILSLPTRTADAAVYVLSRILSVEAQIHIRTLVLFNNIINIGTEEIQSAGSKLVPRQFSKEICMDNNGEKKI
jgi:hypothetical protein